MTFSRRLARLGAVLSTGLALIISSSPLLAQGTRLRSRGAADTAQAGAGVVSGRLIDQLPVDSVAGALLLLPGVGIAANGSLSVRGSTGGATSLYLDGIPVTAGSRRLGLTPGTNALAEAAVLDGPLTAALGNGEAGAIVLRTRDATGSRVSFESDGPLGAASLGLNRAEADIGVRLTRHLTVFGAGVLQGQKSAEPGFGARNAPVFVHAGLDTTVTVGGSPVDVFNNAMFRGSCDTFAQSDNPTIAANYDQPCHGDRTPLSAQSSHQVLLKAAYGDPGLSLGVLALQQRDQARLFDYRTSFVPSNAFGRSTTSDLVALTLAARLGQSGVLHASLSGQSERLLDGPLSTDGELATRDPGLGFMVGQLGFAYDFTTFPIDEALVDNYRGNIKGSRRSPYDLENTAQYLTGSQYRDDPYGLGGFVERGGPLGRLTLYRERRIVGTADAQWQVGPNSRFRLGGEITRYDVDSYTHQLASQSLSDVWIEQPLALSLYAEDQFQYGPVSFSAGVRADRFDSRAARPYSLDTIASSPTFNTYQPFPRISSYDGTFQGRPLVTFMPDQAHTAVSPRFRLAYALSRGSEFRIGYARQAQIPDFAALYAGINTDLAITNGSSVFATDLGLEKSSLAEVGLRQALGRRTSADFSLYERRLTGAFVTTTSLPDPTRNNSHISVTQLATGQITQSRGAEIRLERRQGTITGFAAYAYQHTTIPAGVTGISVATADDRPHTFSAGLAATVGGTAVFTSLRLASGLPYAGCSGPGSESALSGEACTALGGFGIARLPWVRQLDLRLTQTLHVGGSSLTAYVDARNVLNFRNTHRVFAATGATTSPLDREQAFATDSFGFANIAMANAIYGGDGSVDLTSVAQNHGACAAFVSPSNQPDAPDCIGLIRAEQRWGNGDGTFTLAEQQAASDAAYAVSRGEQFVSGAPRRIRVGIQIGL